MFSFFNIITRIPVNFVFTTQYYSFNLTVCKGPNPSLGDIVISEIFVKVFKMGLLGRGFHTLYKECFVPLSTPFGA